MLGIQSLSHGHWSLALFCCLWTEPSDSQPHPQSPPSADPKFCPTALNLLPQPATKTQSLLIICHPPSARRPTPLPTQADTHAHAHTHTHNGFCSHPVPHFPKVSAGSWCCPTSSSWPGLCSVALTPDCRRGRGEATGLWAGAGGGGGGGQPSASELFHGDQSKATEIYSVTLNGVK